jgi:hypothetical protein
MLLHGNSPQNNANAAQYVGEVLSIAMHAMQAGVHSTLGSSQGNLVFNRDMFLNIPLIADRHAITQRRGYDYAAQQMVLKKKWKPKKLGKITSAPNRIVQVHVNGTVTIQLRLGLTERINTRRIIPNKQLLIIKY